MKMFMEMLSFKENSNESGKTKKLVGVKIQNDAKNGRETPTNQVKTRNLQGKKFKIMCKIGEKPQQIK